AVRRARRGRHDRPRDAGGVRLPCRRALGDGRPGVPPCRLRRLQPRRRDAGLVGARAAYGSGEWGSGRPLVRGLLSVALVLAFAAPASRAPALLPLGSFDQPTYATSPRGDDSRIFVTERTGKVRLLVNGVVQPTPFLDLSAIADTDYDERGLLSMAFPPDYAA